MEVFKIKKVFASSIALGILRPLLVVAIAIFAVVTPYLRLSDWGPLIVAAAIGWAIFEGRKIYRTFKFQVAVSDDSIRVQDATRQWSEITRAEFKRAIGSDPAIILTCRDGFQLKIPAAIENFSYIAALVEKRVAEVDKSV